jgi:Coenzyme F420 hydrogenase/dehydrogenase, beta subunit N-term
VSKMHSELSGAGIWAPPVDDAARRDLCTDCGISRSNEPKRCGQACQFIKPDYAGLEHQVHGRARDLMRIDEQFFGPFRQMLRASLTSPRAGAQWTGITTRIAERLRESDAVDAVLTMAPDPDDKWKPVPVLVTTATGLADAKNRALLARICPYPRRDESHRDSAAPAPGLSPRLKDMVPAHIWTLLKPCGITPGKDEIRP